jgi:serine protease Do
VDSAIAGKPLVRPWLGFTAEDVTADVAASLGMPRPIGTLVESIHERGPAAAARLQSGDVVIAVDGREIEDKQALRFRIATRIVGEKVELTVLRRGQTLKIPFELTAPPEDPLRNVTLLRGLHPLAGAKVANLSPALAEELGLEGEPTGVIILEVVPGSPAARISFRSGDIVSGINGRDIRTTDDIEQVITSAPSRWRLLIRRGERRMALEIG